MIEEAAYPEDWLVVTEVGRATAMLALMLRATAPRTRHGADALLDVEGVQDVQLLLEGEFGRVAGGVGQGVRLVDAAAELGYLRPAAGVYDALHDEAVLLG
jgi:hypothetical protein